MERALSVIAFELESVCSRAQVLVARVLVVVVCLSQSHFHLVHPEVIVVTVMYWGYLNQVCLWLFGRCHQSLWCSKKLLLHDCPIGHKHSLVIKTGRRFDVNHITFYAIVSTSPFWSSKIWRNWLCAVYWKSCKWERASRLFLERVIFVFRPLASDTLADRRLQTFNEGSCGGVCHIPVHSGRNLCTVFIILDLVKFVRLPEVSSFDTSLGGIVVSSIFSEKVNEDLTVLSQCALPTRPTDAEQTGSRAKCETNWLFHEEVERPHGCPFINSVDYAPHLEGGQKAEDGDRIGKVEQLWLELKFKSLFYFGSSSRHFITILL